jgi:pimeloyl-[acyl-carrier protein] methyl ester esterase
MSVHVETGDGPDVVLLHGWGMNSGVWSEVGKMLAPRFRVHAPDLPGHGASAACPLDTIEALACHIAQAAPERCAVCGWSLGGQIALAWARRAPRQVSRLALIATSPCFAQRDGWPHALEAQAVHDFSRALVRDGDAMLKRFLALQARGDVRTGQVARRLRQTLSAHRRPDARTLQQGLAILLGTDLRRELPAIQQPALVMHGDRDALVPLAAGEHLSRALPNARLTVMRGAAHAPFVSDPQAAGAWLAGFFDER